MYNSNFLPNQNLLSVIDNCDIKTAFNKILNHFDPNKNKNRKTSILDCTYTYLWNDGSYKLYDVIKTNNINGYAVELKYPIIIYETPYNKVLNKSNVEMIRKFNNLLYDDGVVIVKVNEFKENGKVLKGTFNLQKIFEDNNFYLNDQIIYRYNKTTDNNSEILRIHSYFMIFKKETVCGNIKRMV